MNKSMNAWTIYLVDSPLSFIKSIKFPGDLPNTGLRPLNICLGVKGRLFMGHLVAYYGYPYLYLNENTADDDGENLEN